jgi:hypothetical protein
MPALPANGFMVKLPNLPTPPPPDPGRPMPGAAGGVNNNSLPWSAAQIECFMAYGILFILFILSQVLE